MKVFVAIALLCAVGFAQQRSPKLQPEDPWQPLRFLIGTWEANVKGGSAGAAGGGSYSFQLELRDHVLARHSSSAACKGPADFNCEHGDLLYIYLDSPGQPWKAIYFDNEGHVIHYDVTTPAPQTAIFSSDPSLPGPQYRLIYELKGTVLEGRFQIRAPGEKNFRSYLEWSGARK
jgi:hypothetical protein